MFVYFHSPASPPLFHVDSDDDENEYDSTKRRNTSDPVRHGLGSRPRLFRMTAHLCILKSLYVIYYTSD